MEISNDVYVLGLLKDGMAYTEIIRNSSKEHWEKLLKYQLVRTDASGKVYLTEKGKVARVIGLKKFLRAEELETEMKHFDLNKISLHNKLLAITAIGLLLLLIYLLWSHGTIL
ncbi:hypothetical protein RM553_15235 [Zunongwangia sp. F363]|uniref:Uncharacterized protein n=1 Tax=Autumnicola tepida TaxID=3075595 RepID=A0ABU3CCY0_9FLAO|nr:hypothetical protein [Zunongwangia sp. F363]MDT0644189.1 hypothetical protein [Zunongwangia sp. F363]